MQGRWIPRISSLIFAPSLILLRDETGSQCHSEAPSTSLRVESAEGSLFVSVGKERFFAGAQNDTCARPAIVTHSRRGRGKHALSSVEARWELERLEYLERLEPMKFIVDALSSLRKVCPCLLVPVQLRNPGLFASAAEISLA
jgi:hypothetical protein